MPTQQRYTRPSASGNFDIDGFAEIVAQKIWRRIATMTAVPDEWMTIAEVSKETKMSKQAIYRATKRKYAPLKSYKAGGQLRFKAEDVRAFISENN